MATPEAGKPRALKYLYRAIFGTPPPDEVRGWPGTAGPGLDNLRLLHVGDCGLRAMNRGHDFRAPLGYPAEAAKALLEHGVGIHFHHYFAVAYEALPEIDLLRRRIHLEEDPDVIVVNLGATYGRCLILPDAKPIMKLRVDVQRRLGRAIFLTAPIVRHLVSIFGHKSKPYPGTVELERFLMEARREWPDARIVLLQPFKRPHPNRYQRKLEPRTHADTRAAARRCGVEELDCTEALGRDPKLRSSNNYNVNRRGAGIVGRALANCILGNDPDDDERPQAEAEALSL